MLLNAGLSDRMSRSEMALLLPSPPTALQAMMADIANGIVENKNLHVLAACCKQAAWAPWLLPFGTLTWLQCRGARGPFDDSACGMNTPATLLDGRILFGL